MIEVSYLMLRRINKMLKENIKWKKFKIEDVLGNSNNSKAYHSEKLKFIVNDEEGIPYVTRTNLNNGLFSIVKYDDYKINPSNTISLGAENAKYFYQPYSYITGNKMYYYNSSKINKYSGLFITRCLNDSIKNCGFGYGMGLTGSRSDARSFMLPVNDKEEPNFKFMEEYMKSILQKEIDCIKNYCKKNLCQIEYKEIEELNNKKWKEFNIKKIFDFVNRGKRLKKSDHKLGKIPYVSSTMMNNGVDMYTKGVIRYPHAVCSFKVGLGVKTEGNLVISGTKGYAYVPAPWWKTDYFELRYEDQNKNQKFFYKWDGAGLRYEIQEFISCILNKRFSTSRLRRKESICMAEMMEQFSNRKNFYEI